MLSLLFLLISSTHASEFVVWNVGQGQWTTEIHHDLCLHFDLGGEINVISKVRKTCLGRKNILILSHWDWDHISFAARFSNKVENACLLQVPVGPASRWKKNLILKIPRCSADIERSVKTYIKTDFDSSKLLMSEGKKWNSNDLSRVSEALSSSVLIPGDSTINQEFRWTNAVSRNIRGIVLGHHGSKTSTSKQLLRKLNLRWAVASARKKKYGHPHPRVIELLQKSKVPLLKTEDWGHLHFLN